MTLTNSNTLVLGEPGNGKSAFPKMVVWREAGFYGARRFAAISDPKGEYGPLAEALGMARVRLCPGGRERLNPLDAGPGDPELALLARQTLLAGMLGSVLRRDLTIVEESMLAIAVERLDVTPPRPHAGDLPDLARMLGQLPDELRPPRAPVAAVTRGDLGGVDGVAGRAGQAARAHLARHVRRPVDGARRLGGRRRAWSSTCPACSTTPTPCRWCR